MVLKLSNGNLSIVDGATGAKCSANVRFTLVSDMTGYTDSVAVKYISATSGSIEEITLDTDGDEYIIPQACYAVAQTIMVCVVSVKDSEKVVSNPLYLRIPDGTIGGDILPDDPDTWKTYVDEYVDAKGYVTESQVEAKGYETKSSLAAYPKTYRAYGLIVNNADDDGTIQGTGNAFVTLINDHFARIDFSFKITQAPTSNTSFHWGINRDFFPQLNSNIPTITPIDGGNFLVFNSDGLRSDMLGYGGTFEALNQIWGIGRNYNGTTIGKWQEKVFDVDDFFTGVCYGTY